MPVPRSGRALHDLQQPATRLSRLPFDPTYDKSGKLRRLTIVQATECPYELDGENDPERLRILYDRYDDAHERFNDKIAEWNGIQERRRRAGKAAQTAREFLEFVGLGDSSVGDSPVMA